MTKFLTAFAITTAFLWASADSIAHETVVAPVPLQKHIGPIVIEKKVAPLKVPANNCIVSGGEKGQILEQHVLRCNNRRNWLNINIVEEGAPKQTHI